MIKTLTIKNFKSHRASKIDFCDGLNCIIGKGLSGKSNIVRAIKMLSFYRPLGGNYKSNFNNEKETSIEIETFKGEKVKLLKTKTKSIYFLETSQGKEIFKKIDKNVPEEIKEVLGIKSINFQEQFSEPYLIFSSPEKVTKEINSAMSIDIVDNWIDKVNKRIKKEKLKLENNLEEKNKLESDLKNFKKLDSIKKEYLETIRIEKKIEVMEERKEKIEKLKNNIDIEKIIKKELKENLGKLKKLIGFLEEYKDNDKKIKFYFELKNLFQNLFGKQKEIEDLKSSIEKSAKKFIDLIGEEKICPVCLSTIDKEKIKRVQNEFSSNI